MMWLRTRHKEADEAVASARLQVEQAKERREDAHQTIAEAVTLLRRNGFGEAVGIAMEGRKK